MGPQSATSLTTLMRVPSRITWAPRGGDRDGEFELVADSSRPILALKHGQWLRRVSSNWRTINSPVLAEDRQWM